MSDLHRKILMITIRKACKPQDDCDDHLRPPQPPTAENHPLSPLQIMMICTLAATFSFVCYITIIKICRALKTRSRRRIEITNQTHPDMNMITIDEDHEPVVFHPIWLINTVGLDQSVIDSIEIFKYRKQDGLVDDSDCAVCLGSFQEEESLRLLPKCSHAFHVTCIDTWLRSHKNCPLCRAPVVNNTCSNHQIDQNFVGSSAQEEIPFGDPQNEIINGQEIDTNGETAEKTSFTSGIRVQSDLTDHCSQKLEPMRRSVSLGSFCSVDQESGELLVSQKPNVVPKSVKPTGSSSSISIYSRVLKSSSFGPRIDQEDI